MEPVIQSGVWKDGPVAVSTIHFGQAAARLAVVFFRDRLARMGLTFAAECPAGVRTILVNLESVAREVGAGLSVPALRTGLDFLEPGEPA